jgi:hypothetical protein
MLRKTTRAQCMPSNYMTGLCALGSGGLLKQTVPDRCRCVWYVVTPLVSAAAQSRAEQSLQVPRALLLSLFHDRAP